MIRRRATRTRGRRVAHTRALEAAFRQPPRHMKRAGTPFGVSTSPPRHRRGRRGPAREMRRGAREMRRGILVSLATAAPITGTSAATGVDTREERPPRATAIANTAAAGHGSQSARDAGRRATVIAEPSPRAAAGPIVSAAATASSSSNGDRRRRDSHVRFRGWGRRRTHARLAARCERERLQRPHGVEPFAHACGGRVESLEVEGEDPWELGDAMRDSGGCAAALLTLDLHLVTLEEGCQQ
jgi:hypothetical protein